MEEEPIPEEIYEEEEPPAPKKKKKEELSYEDIVELSDGASEEPSSVPEEAFTVASVAGSVGSGVPSPAPQEASVRKSKSKKSVAATRGNACVFIFVSSFRDKKTEFVISRILVTFIVSYFIQNVNPFEIHAKQTKKSTHRERFPVRTFYHFVFFLSTS